MIGGQKSKIPLNTDLSFFSINIQEKFPYFPTTFYHQANLLWLRYLFSVIDPEILSVCEVPHEETGIFYDGLCFVFLLIQKRAFGSEYFKHVIAELRAQKFFASRGAEIIAKITKQDKEEAEEKERDILTKVRSKMRKIRERNSRDNKSLGFVGSNASGDEAEESTMGQLSVDTSGMVTPGTIGTPSPMGVRPSRPAALRLGGSPTKDLAEMPEVLKMKVFDASKKLEPEMRRALSTISESMEKLGSVEEEGTPTSPISPVSPVSMIR